MEDITEIFINIINQAGSIDIAEAEFKRAVAEDEDLRKQYRQWCHNEGHTEKNGFADFCDEYMEDRDRIWDALSDYDDQF